MRPGLFRGVLLGRFRRSGNAMGSSRRTLCGGRSNIPVAVAYIGSLHPAFLKAPEVQKWRGGLEDLWKYLTETAPDVSPKWVGVIMPHGARVALRVNNDGSRELTIYRREPFTTKDGPDKWTIELLTFRREFKILHWKAEHGSTKENGPLCTFRETTQTLDFFGEDQPT